MLKSSRQSSDDKKCAAKSISWANFYWKPCQQNVEDYFRFNSKPLVGGSCVRFFHHGRTGGWGHTPISKKKKKNPPSSETLPAKCLFLPHNSLSPLSSIITEV